MFCYFKGEIVLCFFHCRHGPIFSIHILRKPFVVVSSFDLVWDVLVKRSYEFSGRITSSRSDLCLGEDIFGKVGLYHHVFYK